MNDGAALHQIIYCHQIHPRAGQQSVNLNQMSMCLHEIQHCPKSPPFSQRSVSESNIYWSKHLKKRQIQYLRSWPLGTPATLSPCSPAQLCPYCELTLLNTGSNGFEVPLRKCISGMTMIHLIMLAAFTLRISDSTISDQLKSSEML